MRYKYCGNRNNISSFEDFVDSLVNVEDVFMDIIDEDCTGFCHNDYQTCIPCYRNEALRYCGKDYPQFGVYKGDQYDDVISSILDNFENNECESSEIVIFNSNEDILETIVIPPGQTEEYTCPNAEITLQNTNGVIQEFQTIPSGGTLTLVAEDAIITINGVNPQSVPSGESLDISVNCSSVVIPIETGQKDPYVIGDDGYTQRGSPFHTLPIVGFVQQVNYFGSKWRLTGTTGGYYNFDTFQYEDVNGNLATRDGAFPSYIVVDHATRNWNEDLLFYYVSSTYSGIGNMDWTSSVLFNTSISAGGFNDWFITNENELRSLLKAGRLSFQPFDVNTNVYLQHGTTAAVDALYYLRLDVYSGATTLIDKLTPGHPDVRAVYVRTGNTSEL